MGYFTTKQLHPWLYSIFDPMGVYSYLAVGREKALLFDTTYGIGSLPDAVKEITDKPLTVVLSHGHVDHSCGAYQFDEVLTHENEIELVRKHTSAEYRNKFIVAENSGTLKMNKGSSFPEDFNEERYMNSGMGNLKKLNSGEIFDLGGLKLEVVPMEGHTRGSIGLLSKEHGILLDSDAANWHIWLFFDESLSVNSYVSMLKRTIKLDFDTFYVGHSNNPLPKSEFEKYISVASNASIEKARIYDNKMFPEFVIYIYEENHIGIAFSRKTLTGT